MEIEDISQRAVLSFSLLVAIVATAGSLYFSLGLGLFPCKLCWYQRILTYPLVIIFGIALWEGRGTVYRTAIPLLILDLVIAVYHSVAQRITSETCSSQFSCSTIQLTLGPLSIPNLSAIAATVMLLAMGVLWYNSRN